MIGLTRAERILDIRTRIDNHIADHGDRPSADCLAVWADVILREELTDMNPDKMTNTEYPFMSERQFQRRHSKEAGLVGFSDICGTDRRNHRKPTRRNRTGYELGFVDINAKLRNLDKQRQYNAFKRGTYRYDGGDLRYLDYGGKTYKNAAI